ncbi:MAG: reverse transcriptase domain-containing protein, partial [Sedimenticola sp.]
MDIQIGTLNVKGLGAANKRAQVFQWLKDKKYSICLLQETHFTAANKIQWEREWGHMAYLSGNYTNKEGVGILISPDLTYTITDYSEIVVGRLQALTININDNDYIIMNVYGPNNDNISLYEKMEDYINEHEGENLIIGGDFNTVLDPDIDKKNGQQGTHRQTRNKLKHIINTYTLCDIWRIQNPNSRKYTWHSNTRPTIFCRLDYFLVSESILNRGSNCKISFGYKSDHSMVSFKLQVTNVSRGPGYFKLNNSLLIDSEYTQLIRQSIVETARINSEANSNTLWEIIKGNVRNETISYATRKKKNDKSRENNIQKQIDTLEVELANDPSNSDITTQIQNNRIELENIYEQRVNGMRLRSKAEWIEGAEKNEKLYKNLEKQNSECKTILSLNVNGQTITDQSDILIEEMKYYEKLYTKRDTLETRHNFFPDNNINKLSNLDKQTCEGLLTEYECSSAVKDMKNNKSPGSDGLTIEFYKIFWNDIKLHLLNSLNYSFETGNLTTLQKQGIITLLPKKDKELSLLSNWRPISLLNVDYKIATKSIANRLKKVVQTLIDGSQTGFIKGRYIGENIRLLFESIEFLNETDSPGLLFFADFEKAFDSVDHNYMLNTLKYFNLGDDFIKWVNLFYSDARSCVSNNGHLSDFFTIGRGVRQGCPLSPYLFIIAIEILSKAIQNDNDIQGVNIHNHIIKNTMFADDATFFTDGTEHSFKKLVEIIDEFGKISGLLLNIKKSIILRVGSLSQSQIHYLPNKQFAWTSDKAQTL